MPKADVKQAGVLGWPVSHSLSPRLHDYWLKKYKVDGHYSAIPVGAEDVEKMLRSLPEKGFAGVNLTIPHKEAALAVVDEADDIARKVGAVNTVIVQGKKLLGTNTDVYGFMANLKISAQYMAPSHALVLGAGGSARAVCAGLTAEGWSVTLAGRTESRAHAIAENLEGNIRIAAWEKLAREMADTGLLVNTTPLGMKGQMPLTVPIEALPRSAIVCDIVYNPLMTLLLTEAKARGHRIVTGLGMLLYQAQPAFEAWFGVRPEVTDELHTYVAGALS